MYVDLLDVPAMSQTLRVAVALAAACCCASQDQRADPDHFESDASAIAAENRALGWLPCATTVERPAVASPLRCCGTLPSTTYRSL